MNIAILASLGGISLTLIVHTIYVSHRLGKYEQKVDTMFGIWFEDAKRDGLRRGHFVKQSPIRLSDDTLRSIAEMATPETMDKAFIILRPHKKRLDNMEIVQWVKKVLGEELLAERADTFDLPHSTYLATWILSIREIEIEGFEAFMERLVTFYNESHTDDPYLPGVRS